MRQDLGAAAQEDVEALSCVVALSVGGEIPGELGLRLPLQLQVDRRQV